MTGERTAKVKVMLRYPRYILMFALAMTVTSLFLWLGTGGDFYTKFEVVEQVTKPVDQNDPLATAGFYDSDMQIETVTRSEFRFGLLPTPRGLLDKHMMSVVSVSGLIWVLALGLLWWGRHRRAA